jgi:serine/threonine protein kinase
MPVGSVDVSDEPAGKATANMRALRGEEPQVAGVRRDGTLSEPSAPPRPLAEGSDPAVGVRLGDRYRLSRKLGEGGMGEVYEALDERLGIPVAVKRITRALPGALDELKARFFREVDATILAQLQGERIVRVSDKGVDEAGRPYFVMELVRGITLKELVVAGSLDQARALHLFEHILKGVVAAHDAKVLHRDLKPGNIMVVRDAGGDETVKILDFGIAKPLETATGQHTFDGLVVGTPGYIAPEAAAGSRSAHVRMDVYALGVILYEMLSGRSPWSAGSASAVLREQQGSSRAPRLRDSVPTAPLWLDELVARAMEADPLKRFQSANELLAALRASMRPETVRASGIDDLVPGTVVAEGAYEIIRRRGEGGMAVVYEARDRHLGRRLALKFLREELGSPELRTRFLNEGAHLAKIDHPGVVRVYNVGEWQGHPFLALELVDGQPLRERMGELTLEQLADVIAQVGEALDAVHDAGVKHRDVTPENILVDGRGRARMVDFGIARDDTSALTRSSMGGMVGRYGYMPPEQAKNARDVSAASDQWSLAAIAYEALVGLPPHVQADDDPEDFDRFFSRLVDAERPPPLPSEVRPSVPPALSAAVMRGLAYEPARRYERASELGRAMRAALEVPARPASATSTMPRGRRWLVAAIAASILVVGGFSVWRLSGVSRERATPVMNGAATNTPLEEPSAAPPLTATVVDAGVAAAAAPLPPSALPEMVTMHVRSEPKGATAIVDGKRMKLPARIERPVGTTVTVLVEKSGYEAERVELTFGSEGGEEVVRLKQRARSAPRPGGTPGSAAAGDDDPFVKPSDDGVTVKPQ